MRVSGTAFLPLLVSEDDETVRPGHVVDEFLGPLGVAYSFGPPYGERLVTWDDLEATGMPRRMLRRLAEENLADALDRVQVHGRPPALMLSFAGIECSVLVAEDFWDEVEAAVPGELVVGVPARDVVIITGTQSRPGMAKARRAVDRVFFAGDRHLLSRSLLVRRNREWTTLREVAPGADDRRSSGPTR